MDLGLKGKRAVVTGTPRGIGRAIALSAGRDAESFRRAFATDLMHTRTLADTALPHLERAGRGAIIAISSISGIEDHGYEKVSHGTMKTALSFYMMSLSRHASARGVRVNVVSPGTTYFEDRVWHTVERDDRERFARTLAKNPSGRMARPEEIANALVFLASDAASFVSGANLVADVTMTIRIQN